MSICEEVAVMYLVQKDLVFIILKHDTFIFLYNSCVCVCVWLLQFYVHVYEILDCF